MIKANMVVAGQEMVVIGLSRRNMDLLLDNRPVMFDGSVVGVPGKKIVVLGGDTEQEIMEDLRSIIGASLESGNVQVSREE